jgi:ubiquinone/menaquinone biosynthesis C-methylase UbiE
MSLITAGFKGGYSRLESWFYDTFIAEVAVQAFADLVDVIGTEAATGPILDVGCGGGQFLGAVARSRPEASLHGADYSVAQVRRAEARLLGFGERIQIHHASAEKLPFEDHTFAAVVSIASIKHWQSQSCALAEMVRVLRPGGLLVVGEVDRGCTVADVERSFALRKALQFFGPIPLMLFRTYVSGLSIDLEDARALVAALPLTDIEVQRSPGLPVLQFQGRKAA